MSKKRKQIVTNPLTQWLLDYTDEHDISLTELSVRAGLSAGSLRSLVKFPERLPALETCMKLVEVTGKAPDEIFQMAGLNGVTPTNGHQPRPPGSRAHLQLAANAAAPGAGADSPITERLATHLGKDEWSGTQSYPWSGFWWVVFRQGRNFGKYGCLSTIRFNHIVDARTF